MKLLVLSVVVGVALAVPWIPEPQTQQDWMPWNWMERHEGFVNNTLLNGNNINVLFYGDSITEAWDYTGRGIWDQYFAPLGAANYGIGGDRTEHVLWRIMNGEVQNLRPRLIVLKIGTNNVGGSGDEDIARGVSAIVDELRVRLPSSKILLLGVLPRNNAETTNFVELINSRISVKDDGYAVRYLNMRDAYYAGNGQFNLYLYTEDLLHLQTQGYAVWQQTMDNLFQQMWNS